MSGLTFASRPNSANTGAAAALQFLTTTNPETEAKKKSRENNDSFLPGLHDYDSDKEKEKDVKEESRKRSRKRSRRRSRRRSKRKRAKSPGSDNLSNSPSEKKSPSSKRRSGSVSSEKDDSKSNSRRRSKSRDKRKRSRRRGKTRSRRRDRRRKSKSRKRSRSGSPSVKKKKAPPPIYNTPVPGGKQIGVRGEWAEFLFPDGSKLFRNILNGQIVTGIPQGGGLGPARMVLAGGTPGVVPPSGGGGTGAMAMGQLQTSMDIPKTTLFILHVPTQWSEHDLAQHFMPFGSLLRADLPKNSDGSRKGYGFVTYQTQEEGQKAIDSMNGFPVQDISGQKTLGVSFRASANVNSSLPGLPSGLSNPSSLPLGQSLPGMASTANVTAQAMGAAEKLRE